MTLACGIHPQHGYPFLLDTAVTYSLADDGLHVQHRVANYGADTGTVRLRCAPVPAGGRCPRWKTSYSPSGHGPASSSTTGCCRSAPHRWSELMLTSLGGVRLGDAELDTAFTDLEQANNRFEHRLTAPDGRGVVLWADPAFCWAQVFSPSIFPIDGPRKAVAVEPVTCGINALNTGEGLIWLEPGDELVRSLGTVALRPLMASTDLAVGSEERTRPGGIRTKAGYFGLHG